MHFWEVVKGAGHSEEEISDELDRIKNGESWCGFDNLPKAYQSKSANWKNKWLNNEQVKWEDRMLSAWLRTQDFANSLQTAKISEKWVETDKVSILQSKPGKSWVMVTDEPKFGLQLDIF